MSLLDYRDSRPIYEQVQDGLRKLMVAGVLQEGEKLPSVRALAGQLAINPNTIQRADEALEREGYVYSIGGKGSFVAPRKEVDTGRRDELMKQLDTCVKELLFLGVSKEELLRHLETAEGGNDHA